MMDKLIEKEIYAALHRVGILTEEAKLSEDEIVIFQEVFKAGMKKVIDWVEHNKTRFSSFDSSVEYNLWDEFQMMKKELGIN